MTSARLRAAALAGAAIFVATCLPAHAASPVTDAFMANAMPNIDFLDRSSRLAITNSKNAHLRDFARSEAREQTLAANDIDGWVEAAKTPLVASAAPDGAILTGRSVAVDGASSVPQEKLADLRMPMGQEDLDRLEGTEGAEFDAMYREKQRTALRQVQSDYEEYIVRGDDPILLSLAQRELPKIKHRLTLLGKM